MGIKEYLEINETDVSTDWLEQVFDDCNYVEQSNVATGFVDNDPVVTLWKYKQMIWKVSMQRDPLLTKATFDIIRQRIEECFGDSNIKTEIKVCDECLSVRFYIVE